MLFRYLLIILLVSTTQVFAQSNVASSDPPYIKKESPSDAVSLDVESPESLKYWADQWEAVHKNSGTFLLMCYVNLIKRAEANISGLRKADYELFMVKNGGHLEIAKRAIYICNEGISKLNFVKLEVPLAKQIEQATIDVALDADRDFLRGCDASICKEITDVKKVPAK